MPDNIRFGVLAAHLAAPQGTPLASLSAEEMTTIAAFVREAQRDVAGAVDTTGLFSHDYAPGEPQDDLPDAVQGTGTTGDTALTHTVTTALTHTVTTALTLLAAAETCLRTPEHLGNVVISTMQWPIGDKHVAQREFLFRVQRLFGVRVRSGRTDGAAWLRISGTPRQRVAFEEACFAIRDEAEPLLADMSMPQRREFWATLGELCAASDRADTLTSLNAARFESATDLALTVWGPARTLPRAASAEHGPAYESALDYYSLMAH
jgi:hypothetical protein